MKRKLVLSGSGIRFPMFVGGLKRLQEAGYEFEEVCGTSGGAIVGSGLASGFSIDEMANLCREFLPGLTKYLDFSIFRFLWRWGLIRGEKIEEEFEKRLTSFMGSTHIPIKIIVVNYDRSSLEQPYKVLSSEGTPDISLSKAVRASMSVPLVFEPVEINGERYIDGGVSANFPVDIYGNRDDVIGLYMEPEPLDSPPNRKWGFKGLVQYMLDIMEIFMNSTTQEHIEDVDKVKIIPLKPKYRSLNFFLDLEDVDNMIEDGYKQVDEWLKNNNVLL